MSQVSSAGEGLMPLSLTLRGTRGDSATGAGLLVAPRRPAAFAMRLAAETRAERVRAAGVVVEAGLRRFLLGVAAGAEAGMAAPSEVGVATEVGLARRAARRGALEDGLLPVDFGVAFAMVEVGCDALVLDGAALGLVTLGLVALVLADSFAGDEDAFRVVRAGFAADFALVVCFTAAVGAAVSGEDPRASERVALLGRVELRRETLAAAPAERLLAVLSVDVALADLRDEVAGATTRVRWESTKAHSSSLRLAGLAPWAWATRAAFSMSAIRLLQEVAKRLSDWDLAPLSTRVSITPDADTFLRRRLKISFWSWAIRASALSLSWIVS